MKRTSLVALLLIFSGIALEASAIEKSPCQITPLPIIGKCFTIHGRLTTYNGNPALRIWVIGTHHLLGISDAGVKNPDDIINDTLPENVHILLKEASIQAAIYGDYKVCPLSKEISGEMQDICLVSASHLIAIPYHGLRVAMPHYSVPQKQGAQ